MPFASYLLASFFDSIIRSYSIMALYLHVKAWIHPPEGKTPQVMKPLKQPGDDDDTE
jgi:hypothetical protein